MAQIGKVFNLLLVLLYRSTNCCWRSSICKRRCWYRTRDCSGSVLRIFWCWWQNFDIDDIFWILMLDSYFKRWWRKIAQKCRQHISSPTSVTNINVAKLSFRFATLFRINAEIIPNHPTNRIRIQDDHQL